MRWLFHRERAKRYQIVIQELRSVFTEKQGWNLFLDSALSNNEQLNFEEESLVRKFRKLVYCLYQDKKNAKRQHHRFSKIHRKMTAQVQKLSFDKEWHSNIYILLLEFCSTKYHRTHFFSFGRELLDDLFFSLTLSKENPDSKQHFSNFSFLEEAHLIEESEPFIFFERDFRKFDEFMIKRKFDSHRYNLPFLLYTFAFYRQGAVKKIKMVRMGSPTKESWFLKPVVVDEFRGFLTHLKMKHKNHLYINKQRTWGEEGRRSKVIKELEDAHSNFSCVCLPSDGDFYHQTGRFQNVSDAEKFKSLFDSMLKEKVNIGYYYLPKVWRADPEFCQGLLSILDEVHSLYFKEEKELSAQQRKKFIDLAYTHLIIFFLQYAPIDSVNITCRDGIDRAGCEQSKLFYYFQISMGMENEIEAYKELQYILHFPVYLAKTRPIVPERREFLSTLFKEFNAEVKCKIRKKYETEPLLFTRPHFNKRKYPLD